MDDCHHRREQAVNDPYRFRPLEEGTPPTHRILELLSARLGPARMERGMWDCECYMHRGLVQSDLTCRAGGADEAARVLAGITHEKLNDTGLTGTAAMLDNYTVPKTWYEGLIARGKGDESAALTAFTAARRTVEQDLDECCVEAKTVAMLSLIHAELGNRDEAVTQARHAVEMLPVASVG